MIARLDDPTIATDYAAIVLADGTARTAREIAEAIVSLPGQEEALTHGDVTRLGMRMMKDGRFAVAGVKRPGQVKIWRLA